MNILVSFPAPREKLERLEKLGKVYVMEDLKKEDMEKIDVLFVYRWSVELKGLDIKSFKNLKIVQSLLAGVDNLPFSELKNKIVLKNSGASSGVIAEHVFGFILSRTRNIIYQNASMRAGKFEQLKPARSLNGKTMGIIGYGSIGREVARIARAFNMNTFAIARHVYTDVSFSGTLDDLDHVLKSSDIVVIAMPLSKHTRNLIDRQKLSMMKRDAILVNISRGNVVNEHDLFEHLKENRDFTACLDVWWHYPGSGAFRQEYPFETLENVIMTPHSSAIDEDYYARMIENGIENLFRYFEGATDNIVNNEDYE